MSQPGLHQIQCLDNDHVRRDEGDIVGAHERARRQMVLIGPINEGKIGGGVNQEEAGGRLSGHALSRRGPHGDSR